MEGRLGNDQAMTREPVTLLRPTRRLAVLLAAALTAFMTASPALAQYFGERPIRYGNTSGYFFDGRGDDRDFPTNGFFPGNFAAHPFYAQNGGAAGFLESNPQRSLTPYPSQTYFRFMREGIDCREDRLPEAAKARRCGRVR